MGGEMSQEERRKEEKKRRDWAKRLPEGPNLMVNKSIVMFCSLSSSDHLEQHYEKKKMKLDGKEAAAVIKKIVEKLSGLIPHPKLAGLGALAIGIFIDATFATPSEKSTKEALRSVFAEEKASEVWDQIDECLKRCMMYIKDEDELRSNIERIEIKLSDALTKLKNSMKRKGQMTNEALKAWVNGAAFHIQMLIHLVRLRNGKSCSPIEAAILTYQQDLESLFKIHYELINGKCYQYAQPSEGMAPNPTFLIDEDSQRHFTGLLGNHKQYFEAYYDHRYKRQKGKIQQYFSDVEENLQKLVEQKGFFNV